MATGSHTRYETGKPAGLAAGAAALGVSELAAGAMPHTPSLIESVGDAVVDVLPAPLIEFGISVFGSMDKIVFVGLMLVICAAAAAALGAVAVRRWPLAASGFALFGAFGVAAALRDPQTSTATVALSAGLSVAAGLATLTALLRLGAPGPLRRAALPALPGDGPASPSPQPMSQTDRRAFLGAAGAVTAGAVVSAAAGRALVGSRMESVRNRYALPPAAQPVTPPPPGASFSHQGLAPLIVPNDEFYRIDTRLVGAPRIDIDRWRLRITGMVEEPFSLTFEELLAMPLVEEHVTLSCVSNEVGGDLVGTAAWRGVRLDGLLERAGVQPGATQLVGRAVDGFTVGFPTEAALDGRDALVAVGMNGELLPLIHGFPARLVVPGLYGYVSATKWLSEIELTRWEDFDAYWIPRGWDKRAPVLTQSRIDTVVPRTPTAGQPAVVAGVAWAPTRGVSRVEVNIDGDGWREAELAAPLTDDTWRQWRYRWEPTAGQHVVAVRATDGRGDTQTSERTPPGPNGATGYHTIRVDVAEGHGGRGEQAG